MWGRIFSCLSVALSAPSDLCLVSHAQERIPTCTSSSRITSTDYVEPRSATYRQRVIGLCVIEIPGQAH
ncbi:hypothetical protein NEUTE1DRAFT_117321 [Neurospora tetrasperma FGSC 2508]|uniref:Uncharacterized protein n=1 Tax=Neurospora tetrasperma (strain FGSC 2508 / ATCC MYA-4615 / P0657) TaxID=510951 RepID=F8MPZ2_NEUT8|nr:uncharacterized protein NEUTE1DRAFT_117321 [Neurospora tetrasperma FGSC 2508]EGO56422.1 hypothetical protein NEUTE1DRAFT_117321 [Neurospora tetrasperma FGSC 2508]EGZ70715.1 hypothetical protein NEUTE2DRAFT_145154 [Neurospora tetrasperma FGSC 2509]